jgi:hypothetical protein
MKEIKERLLSLGFTSPYDGHYELISYINPKAVNDNTGGTKYAKLSFDVSRRMLFFHKVTNIEVYSYKTGKTQKIPDKDSIDSLLITSLQ